MSNHSFTNILEYIQKRYVGLSSKQLQDRQAVYSFKDGNCPSYVKELLLEKINSVISPNPSAWVVCFIPASTKAKHLRRYHDLSNYLNDHLSCPVYIDGIDVMYDRESGYVTGKTNNPIENMKFNPGRFAGKKVVLVDDVRTRGVTFDKTADELVSFGAVSVFGVFLAQTIHPNLPIDTTPRARGGYDDEFIDDFIAEDLYQEELANEFMEEDAYLQEFDADIYDDIPDEYF